MYKVFLSMLWPFESQEKTIFIISKKVTSFNQRFHAFSIQSIILGCRLARVVTGNKFTINDEIINFFAEKKKYSELSANSQYLLTVNCDAVKDLLNIKFEFKAEYLKDFLMGLVKRPGVFSELIKTNHCFKKDFYSRYQYIYKMKTNIEKNGVINGAIIFDYLCPGKNLSEKIIPLIFGNKILDDENCSLLIQMLREKIGGSKHLDLTSDYNFLQSLFKLSHNLEWVDSLKLTNSSETDLNKFIDNLKTSRTINKHAVNGKSHASEKQRLRLNKRLGVEVKNLRESMYLMPDTYNCFCCAKMYSTRFTDTKIRNNTNSKELSVHNLCEECSLTENEIKQRTYNIYKEVHEAHAHHKLKERRFEQEKYRIGVDQEGCPCCLLGVDFDEFAAAIKMMLNSNACKEELHQIADFSDSHWGIFFGVALPFAAIGLAAAIRNIEGSWSTKKKLTVIIKGINEEIQSLEDNIQKLNKNDKNLESRKRLLNNLKAFRAELKYSKLDANFNLYVPGALNGAASGMVLSTGIWSQAFALPVIATYAMCQFARNIYDFCRIRKRKEIIEPIRPTSQPKSTDGIKKDSTTQWSEEARINIGKRKINQIANSKRRFFSSNAFNFAVFGTGAILTFISIPALAVGVGAAGLPIGLAMLGYGAATTGYANNIWTNKFKPRNGDLGIARLNTEKDYINAIGERRQMKRILKSSKKKWVRNNKGKRFFYKCLTAMPGRSSKGVPYILPKWSKPYFIYGRSTGQQLLKKDNICRFESAKEQLEHSRSKILSELLNVKGVNMAWGEIDEGDLSNQWKACTTLGIDVGVLNLLIEDAKSECNGGCSGTHSNSEFIRKLNSTGIFEIEDGEKYVRLKNMNELTDQQKKVFGEKIDYYLHFDLIKKLRYQERGIDAHLWQFRSFNKKTF